MGSNLEVSIELSMRQSKIDEMRSKGYTLCGEKLDPRNPDKAILSFRPREERSLLLG